MKQKILNHIFQFLFSFFFIVGVVLIILGFNNYKIINFTYNEDNDIKYKVYLKENKFFETKFLEENRTYISSLIDYIDIDYHYNIKYSVPVTGEYTYKLVAIVSANKTNSDEYYWQREYDLSDEKKGIITNSTDELSIDENIKISYDKYNEILNKFKREYSFASDGILKVAMVINNNVYCEYSDEPIVVPSNINLSIPLMEQTVEASISKDAKNSASVLEYKQKDTSIIYFVYKISGIGLVLLSLIHFCVLIISKLTYKRKNEYEVTLNRILKNYDSIIANVNSKPVLTGFKTVEVSDFSELLDIYNEVRMPINYYQNTSKNISTFIIYNENIVWIYELKKDDFIEGGNSSAKKKNTSKE